MTRKFSPPAWLYILMVTGGSALRLWASCGDLWLDEIWSLNITSKITYPWDPFIHPGYDGHASLMTYWMMFLSDAQRPILLRLPAVLCSAALLLALSRGLFGKDHTERFMVSVLYAVSFVFTLYGSEARGYGGMLLFGALALSLAARQVKSPTIATGLSYGICAISAILFHPSFLVSYAAILPWMAIALWKKNSLPKCLSGVLAANALPLFFIAALVLYSPTLLNSGGGPRRLYSEVLLSSLSVLIGGPELAGLDGAAIVVMLIIIASLVALIGYEIICELREKRDDAALLSLVLIASPLLILGVLRPHSIFPRYFLVSLLCALIFLGRIITRLLGGNRGASLLAVLLFTAILGSNFERLVRLINYGRGQYSAALSAILSRDSAQEVLLISDHDTRNRILVDYFAPRLHDGSRLKYLQNEMITAHPPRWYFTHSLFPETSPSQYVRVDQKITYELVQSFPFAGLSGWSWFLYERR